MLEKLEALPEGVIGVKASGTLTKQDYVDVMEPMLDAVRREGRRIRFVYQFAPEFKTFSGGAAWEDARMGLATMRLFDGLAIVADAAWLRDTASFAHVLMPCPVHAYSNAEFDQAVAWLAALPSNEAIPHRLIPEKGVLVVEPREALRASDFDALALTVDPWIASHGELHGLVLHVSAFPGWQDVGSFMRHIKFIRDHQRKVRKVALAIDAKLADIAPHVAEHFVEAEIRHFGYDQLDEAIAWAGVDQASQGAA